VPWIDPVLQIDVHGKAKSSERCKYIQRLVFSQQGMGGGVHRVELAIRTVRFVDILSHVILNYPKSEPGDTVHYGFIRGNANESVLLSLMQFGKP